MSHNLKLTGLDSAPRGYSETESHNPVPIAETPIRASLHPPTTARICAAKNCTAGAKRQFCSDTCAARERQRRRRVALVSAPSTVIEATLSVTVTYEPASATAFGVPCDADVASIFADDAERFRQMGYVFDGRRTA